MPFSIDSIRGQRTAERCITGAALRAMLQKSPHTDGETVLNSWALYAPKELADFAWKHREALYPRVEALLQELLDNEAQRDMYT